MPRRPVEPVVSRATFEALRRPAGRARRGPIRVAFVPMEDTLVSPQVAFSVSKRCGGAVQRNTIRRRVLAAVATFATEVAPGAYLVGTDAEVTDLPFDTLIHTLHEAFSQAGGPRSSTQ